MSSTKENVPLMAKIWLPMSLMLIVMLLSFSDLFYFSPKQRESSRKSMELSRHYRDEVLAIKRAQIDNLKEIKERLIVLEAAMRNSRPEEETTPMETDPSVSSQADEFVGKLESMSDEEYQAMVLAHVKAIDRQLIEQHFKRENAFKVSLKASEKQKFDADVKKAYAKLLASCKVEGELSSLQKEAIRRGAESMVIVEWRVKESMGSREAQIKRSNERWKKQREELRRLREEESLLGLGKEMEAGNK